MIRIILIILIMNLTFSGVGCDSPEQDSQSQALGILNPERDFTLTDQDGLEFHLKDHRGKIVLLFFGFLSCPDICPVTMSKLTKVYKLLGTRSNNVLTVFVSVDPQRDTPEKLKEYLAYFKIKAIGLTGTKDAVDHVVEAFKGYYHINPTDASGGYMIDHSSFVYVLDRQGRVRALSHFEDPPDKIAAQIKKLI